MDNKEYEDFYHENADRVFRFCYRLTGDRTKAEDIASEAFGICYLKFDNVRVESAQTTYLFRIVVRLWGNQQRKDRLATLVPFTRQPKEDHEMRLDLDVAIERLPSAQRVALILVKAEGMTHAETAEILGVPIGTIQSRVFQALKGVRKHLMATESKEITVEN